MFRVLQSALRRLVYELSLVKLSRYAGKGRFGEMKDRNFVVKGGREESAKIERSGKNRRWRRSPNLIQ